MRFKALADQTAGARGYIPEVVAAVRQTLPDHCVIDGEIDRCYICLGFERIPMRAASSRLALTLSGTLPDRNAPIDHVIGRT